MVMVMMIMMINDGNRMKNEKSIRVMGVADIADRLVHRPGWMGGKGEVRGRRGGERRKLERENEEVGVRR